MSFTKFLTVVTFLIIASPIVAVDAVNIKSIVNQLSVTSNSDPIEISKKDQIKEISIRGNKSIKTTDILPKILLKKGDSLNPFKIRRSVKNIQSTGYFKTVESDVKKSDSGITLTFIVNEHDPIAVISFSNNQVITDDELSTAIQSKPGAIFNIHKARKDIQRIESLYKENGYFQAKVFDIDFPTDSKSEIKFHISEGIVNSITITGNIKTKDYVILRELDIEPGDVKKI